MSILYKIIPSFVKNKQIVKRVWKRYYQIQAKVEDPNTSKWKKKKLKHERTKLKTILGIKNKEKDD